MISENAFTEKDKNILAASPLKSEMAIPNEWIVREDARPDELLNVYVVMNGDGQLWVACTCIRGAQDVTCPHALDVITRIRSDEAILIQLSKQRDFVAA